MIKPSSEAMTHGTKYNVPKSGFPFQASGFICIRKALQLFQSSDAEFLVF
jgi:hypothetical protein